MLLMFPAFALWAMTPSALQSKLHYAWRYIVKFTQRTPIQDMRLHAFPKTRSKPDTNSERLASFLQMDIISLIATRLHYVDLVSLSLVSKGVRKAIFPPSAATHTAEQLRILTCDAGTKSQCWSCNKQICKVGMGTKSPFLTLNLVLGMRKRCNVKCDCSLLSP